MLSLYYFYHHKSAWRKPRAILTQIQSMNKTRLLFLSLLTSLLGLFPSSLGSAEPGKSPEPPVVSPGPPGGPPSDAIVLFDGKDLSSWRTEQGQPAAWRVENG